MPGKLPFVELLKAQQIDGTAHANTTTPGSLLLAGSGAAKSTLASDFFEIGRVIRIAASGRISTHSTPPTLTLDIRLGSVVVFNGGASPTLVASASNLTWEMELELVCRALGGGTAANLYGSGKLTSFALSATVPVMLLPASSPGVGSGFDSTAPQVVDFFATWSAANAANTIRCDKFNVLALN